MKRFFLFSLRAFMVMILITIPCLQHNPGVANAQNPGPNYPIYFPLIGGNTSSLFFGPGGGSVVALAADPKNSTVVYAGTLNGGIFKTTNATNKQSLGQQVTWTAVNNGLGELFIDSLAIDPVNTSIVYAGTHGMGIYKTNNGGASWFPVNNGIASNAVVYTVAVNPGNHDLVYAGTRIEGTTYTGITYKSTNGGASWSQIMYFTNNWVYSIAVDPYSPNIVMAAVHQADDPGVPQGPIVSRDYGNKGSFVEGTAPSDANYSRWIKGRAVAFGPSRAYYTAWEDGYIAYSNDDGSTWRMAAGSLGAAQIYPNGISINRSNTNIVYLADHNHGSYCSGCNLIPGQVLRSGDAGTSYYPTSLVNRYVYSVAAISSGDMAMAGLYSDGLYKTDDGGSGWYRANTGLINSKITGMVFPGGSTIFASTPTGGGIFKSTDNGATWTDFNSGVGDTQVNGLVMHPTNHNILFALTNKAGLRRIDLSAGSTWSAAGIIPLGNAVPAAETSSQFAPPPAADGLMDPGQETVGKMAVGASAEAAVSAPVLSLAFSPVNANIAYLGTNGGGVYATTDGGLNWAYVGMAGGVVRGLAVSMIDPNIVYAATNQNGIGKFSPDGGKNWYNIALPAGLSGVEFYSVAVWPKDPTRVYFGTSNGVYSWSGINDLVPVGLGGTKVFALGSHPSAPRQFYAATDWGTYAIANTTYVWTSVDNQFTGSSVSVNFNPANTNYTYIGTESRGAMRIAQP